MTTSTLHVRPRVAQPYAHHPQPDRVALSLAREGGTLAGQGNLRDARICLAIIETLVGSPVPGEVREAWRAASREARR